MIGAKEKNRSNEFDLSDDQRKILLTLAFDSIRRHLADGSSVARPANLAGALGAKRGAFVTLRKAGELRGCVGYTRANRPLWDTVADAAISSAFHDTRFSPVQADEVDDLEIEISVLGSPLRVSSWKEIALGEHGIIMNKDGRRALFLPQVATEYGWDVPTTLGHLARKAGLADDAWKEGADFEIFTALKFSR